MRFQNANTKDKPGGTPRKGGNVPATPPTPRKDTVSEIMDEEEVQETDYDTEDLADLPTDSSLITPPRTQWGWTLTLRGTPNDNQGKRRQPRAMAEETKYST